jgi:Right handed beta helix region
MMITLTAFVAMASFVAQPDVAVDSVQPELPPQLPLVTVERDDTVIDRSCRVVIPRGTIIADANGDGVIHIRANDITVEFVDGSAELIGAAQGTPWDELKGVGIRIDGFSGVTLRNAHVHRYHDGIYATNADGLVIERADVSGGYAQRLRSTPVAEDGGDWLSPHNNDDHQWLKNYGAGIYVERSDGVTIKESYARWRQNGIIIDRVSNARIYDNDFSFLSGWGLAMWRSSDNVISRNAFDFCVRGYSHGVYNRGQDSAGILMFEQNSRNVIAENSATHGGDGFFGFGGREALGETAGDDPDVAAYARRGNNDNLLIDNDFSYSPAHGIEMTFSFGNMFLRNRIVENSICGVWGGYSQDTLIALNEFTGNGEFGYGLERGGVNIEHGYNNRILANTFRDNKCGVHLWWDPDGGFLRLPWAQANAHGAGEHLLPSARNIVADNTFTGDLLALHLRDSDPVIFTRNTMTDVGEEIRVEGGKGGIASDDVFEVVVPKYEVFGETRPVGARKALRGKEKIVMTEWFAWDHAGPLVREVDRSGSTRVFELYNLNEDDVTIVAEGLEVKVDTPAANDSAPTPPTRVTLTAPAPGVYPYTIDVNKGNNFQRVVGTMIASTWEITAFAWPKVVEGGVPPADLAAWRAIASGDAAVHGEADALSLAFGFGGPSDVGLSEAITAAKLGGDYFGVIAKTRLPLNPGRWRVTTRSDDGVRVMVNGTAVIVNWTHHGPTLDVGEFVVVAGDESVVIEVEHFEIFGFAVLELGLEKVTK